MGKETANCHFCQRFIDDPERAEVDVPKDDVAGFVMRYWQEKYPQELKDMGIPEVEASPAAVALQPLPREPSPMVDVGEDDSERTPVQANVKRTYKWSHRNTLRQHAQEQHEARALSREDVYLINLFIVGDSDIFAKTKYDPDSEATFTKLWKVLNDRVELQKFVTAPVYQYAVQLLDDPKRGPWDAGMRAMLEAGNIHHTVTLVVDTAANVYSRGRRGEQFTKFNSGGGTYEKSAIHAHWSARDGPSDEFGIGFHNRAVKAISPPSLMVTVRPEKHRWDAQAGRYRLPLQFCWVQIMVIDFDDVVRLPEEQAPVKLGKWPWVPTGGEWGHYEVGGERMQCPEAVYHYGDHDVAFCREPLKDIHNSKVRWHYDYGRQWQDWLRQWRPVDYNTLLRYKDEALIFVDDYVRSRNSNREWAESPSGSYETAKRRNLCTGEVESCPDHYGHATAKYFTEEERIAEGLPIEAVVESHAVLNRTLETMNQQVGVWQEPWPELDPVVARVQRSHEFWRAVQSWPVGETLTGTQTRDLTRVLELIEGMSHDLTHSPGLLPPCSWVGSPELERTKLYENLHLRVTEAQVFILEQERWAPAAVVPPFDAEVAGGYAGVWNYAQPRQVIGKKQRYKPLILHAEPNHDDLDEFWRIRLNSTGEPVLNQFKPRVDHPGNWCEYKVASFDRTKLPKRTTGQHSYGDVPQWEKMWHGAKTEAAYAIGSDVDKDFGGFMASDDRDAGHRHLNSAKALYMHADKDKEKIFNYTRPAPLIGDGTYVSVAVEMLVDVTHRIPNGHKDQKTQKVNAQCQSTGELGVCPGGPSVYVVAIWMKHVGYQDLNLGDEISLVWNPALEAMPRWMQERRGAAYQRVEDVVWRPKSFAPVGLAPRPLPKAQSNPSRTDQSPAARPPAMEELRSAAAAQPESAASSRGREWKRRGEEDPPCESRWQDPKSRKTGDVDEQNERREEAPRSRSRNETPVGKQRRREAAERELLERSRAAAESSFSGAIAPEALTSAEPPPILEAGAASAVESLSAVVIPDFQKKWDQTLVSLAAKSPPKSREKQVKGTWFPHYEAPPSQGAVLTDETQAQSAPEVFLKICQYLGHHADRARTTLVENSARDMGTSSSQPAYLVPRVVDVLRL